MCVSCRFRCTAVMLKSTSAVYLTASYQLLQLYMWYARREVKIGLMQLVRVHSYKLQRASSWVKFAVVALLSNMCSLHTAIERLQ